MEQTSPMDRLGQLYYNTKDLCSDVQYKQEYGEEQQYVEDDEYYGDEGEE